MAGARVQLRVHVTVRHVRRVRKTTRQAQEDHTPLIMFPDNETFVASDVDFMALFPASLLSLAPLKRFSCTRCQLAAVPTTLFELSGLAEVDLPGNEIRDVPVQFQSSVVTTLDLAKNRFTRVPDDIWAMPELTTLNLSGNAIASCQSPETASIKNAVSHLQTLILDNNPIEIFSCSFLNLETLSLTNASLTALPSSLASSPSLTSLAVGRNPKLRLESNANMTLPNLRELDLSSNGLESVPTELALVAPQLTTIRLDGNKLSNIETLKAVGSLDKLRTLVLDGNAIVDATAILSGFSEITNLSMASNGISELNGSKPFESLRFLNLSKNDLSNFTLTVPNLEILDLSNNSFTEVSNAIFNIPNLKELHLTGNRIEPFELTSTQFAFFSSLQVLTIEQTAFASCAVKDHQQLPDGKTVCVAPSAVSTPAQTTLTPATTPTNNARSSSASDQLLYLGGSFVLAVLIALWIFTVRRRRAQQAAGAENNSSLSPSLPPPPSASSALPSPSASTQSNPFSDGGTGRRPLSSGAVKFFGPTGEAGRASTRASHKSHTSVRIQAMHRESSDESAFGEDQELQAWRVEYEGVAVQTLVAVGTFTEVWRASYRTDTVAVKKLKSNLRMLHQHHPEMVETGVLDDFIFEIRVLSRLNHPRIVAFYGAAWTTDFELTAIMEYLPQQDLRGFIDQRQRQSMGTTTTSERVWTVEMVRMVLCVAEALTCLHSLEPPLVHGNVQAKNVLLDGHMDAKLCDFGSAQYCAIPLLSFSDQCGISESDGASSSFSLASVRANATPWIAPEVLRNQAVCDPSIDMYAFGVLLSQIDTGDVPYTGNTTIAALNDLQLRHRVAIGSLRPEFTSTCPLSILALGMRCLAFEPHDRPTSTDAMNTLREILAEMERQSHTSASTLGGRSTIGPLLNLQSTDSSVSDSDMSQRTIEYRRYSSA